MGETLVGTGHSKGNNEKARWVNKTMLGTSGLYGIYKHILESVQVCNEAQHALRSGPIGVRF